MELIGVCALSASVTVSFDVIAAARFPRKGASTSMETEEGDASRPGTEGQEGSATPVTADATQSADASQAGVAGAENSESATGAAEATPRVEEEEVDPVAEKDSKAVGSRAPQGLAPPSLSFSLTCSDDLANPRVFSLGPAGNIKVGRHKKSQLHLDKAGISWTHMEFKYLSRAGSDGSPALGLKDTSSNGVGIKTPEDKEVRRVDKDAEVVVPHGSYLVIPFKVKPKEGETTAALQTCMAVAVAPPGGTLSAAPPVASPMLPAVAAVSASKTNGKPAAPPAPAVSSSSTKRRRTYSSSSSSSDEADQGTAAKSAAASKAAKEGAAEKKRKTSGSKGAAKEAEKAHAESLRIGLYVKIIGLRSRAELNGKVCEIVGFDEKQGGIWKVRLEDGSGKAFRATNLAHLSDKDAWQKMRVQAALHSNAASTGQPAQPMPAVVHNHPGLPPGQPPPPKMPPPDPIPAAEASHLNSAIAAAAAAAARTNTTPAPPSQTSPAASMSTMSMMPMMAAAAAAAGMPPMVPTMGMGMPMMGMPMMGMPMGMPAMGMPGMPPPPSG
eukprot:TRINITY_DN123119_c0_g1_i1.p1 TRINITY_DN123119_c0_g1~~TRINITY_DN123119_c0_g1_i1.p1  ORF type:complete len:555 (-),score=106.69 TRINITY_DN123119_c0_g1_i1:49-1713(-)